MQVMWLHQLLPLKKPYPITIMNVHCVVVRVEFLLPVHSEYMVGQYPY